MEEIDDSDVSDTISGSQAGVDTKAKKEKKEKVRWKFRGRGDFYWLIILKLLFYYVIKLS